MSADWMTRSTEAAALHGMATNQAFPLTDRYQYAMQALRLYEAELEARDKMATERWVMPAWMRNYAHIVQHDGPTDFRDAPAYVEKKVNEHRDQSHTAGTPGWHEAESIARQVRVLEVLAECGAIHEPLGDSGLTRQVTSDPMMRKVVHE